MHNRLRPRVFTASAAATATAGDPGQPPPPPPPTAELRGLPAPSPSLQSQTVSTVHSGDRKGQQVVRCLTSPAPRPRLDPRARPDAIKIVDVVGSGVCGILCKWGNYRKGWRPRWCTLNDGVLTFYKIHGPDSIMFRDEEEIGGKLIGLESFRRMCSRQKSSHSSRSSSPKPVGEIYLKISTIRESRSDEKRFSIYTGTKTVHLRAETSEARGTWLNALNAAKEMFPRTPTRGMHAVPIDDLVASIEKLREQLLKEGVSETAIQDCEQIMKDEFYSMHHQLSALKQKEILFLEAIGHLEADKVDLKHTFLDETQGQVKDSRASFMARHMSHGRSPSDPDENNDEHDNCVKAVGNMDERCQDAEDFLSVCSSDSSESEFQGSADEEEAFETEDALMMKYSYPYVKRRKKLPDPVENERGFSLWSIIKDNIGKDLTKICLPVYFNEPVSSLQKGFEDLEYSYLIDRAYEWGKRGNNLMRILNVAAFAVSGYASTEGRSCKPFNPLLGETYEADYPDKGIRFISEKVSHHPMVIAFHCDGQGWKFWADCNLKNKFAGRSIQVDPVGVLTLEFDDGEVYQWSKVTTAIYNLILGKVYCDHHGTMQIQGSNEHTCKIRFKEPSIIDRNPHQVQGAVVDKNRNTVAKLLGKWNESLYYLDGDNLKKGKGSDFQSQSRLLWRCSKPPKFQTRYNLSRFAMTLNELTPGLKEKLPPTDSRLRPDQRHLENGEFSLANKEKLRLEERQRQAGKMQEEGWKPRWFVKDRDGKAYRYAGGYWEAREQDKWESCPDIFGETPPNFPNT